MVFCITIYKIYSYLEKKKLSYNEIRPQPLLVLELMCGSIYKWNI